MGKFRLKSSLGFSLIELMISIAIVGTLAAIVIPAYHSMTNKVRVGQIKTLLSSFYQANQAFYGEYTQYFGDWKNIGFMLEGEVYWHFGFSGALMKKSPAAPPGYVGPGIQAGMSATGVNTDAYCTGRKGKIKQGSCNTELNYTNCPSMVGQTWTKDTFVAFGCGLIIQPDGRATYEYWSIDHTKKMRNSPIP